jgi:putative transposase
MTCWPSLQGFCADQGYRGTTVRAITTLTSRTIDIPDKTRGQWTQQPKRWIVERSHAWNDTNRRLAKDYETKPSMSEAALLFAAIRMTLNKLIR